MNGSGYSSKPLVQKLGFLSGDTIYVKNIPDELKVYYEANGLRLVHEGPAVWFHGFFTSQQDLEQFAQITTFATIEKGLWLSWPKRASNVPTDLTEQNFRDLMLPMRWVDTKVAAIDQTWSGLKFLRRKK